MQEIEKEFTDITKMVSSRNGLALMEGVERVERVVKGQQSTVEKYGELRDELEHRLPEGMIERYRTLRKQMKKNNEVA